MKKFQFRLDPVLKLRKYKERMAQMALAKAQVELKNAMSELDSAKMREQAARSAWTAGLEKGMWDAEFKMHADHVRGLEQETKAAESLIIQLEEIVAQRQKGVLDAAASRKTMDLLKDSRLAEYRIEAERADQKEADELANLHRASQKEASL